MRPLHSLVATTEQKHIRQTDTNLLAQMLARPEVAIATRTTRSETASNAARKSTQEHGQRLIDS